MTETNVLKSKKNRSFVGGERIAAYFGNNDGMINFPEFVFFTADETFDEQILKEFLKADVDGKGVGRARVCDDDATDAVVVRTRRRIF